MNSRLEMRRLRGMRWSVLYVTLVWLAWAPAAYAACIVEYKAKMDNPLRLDHGTITVQASNCSAGAVEGQVRAQLASRGWTLLNILSVRQSG